MTANETAETMNWFRRRAETITVLIALSSCFIWMNSRFNEIERELGDLKKEVAIVKTVMIMKQIMPCELAKELE